MRRLTLLVVAALVFSGGGPSLVGLASTRTSTANVELAPGTDTTPVKPVDPDGSGGVFPGDDLDPDNQGTGSRGLLTLDYVSNLAFQQQATKAGVITATATNQRAFVQISDRRGTGTGWSLLVKPTTLVGQQDQDSLTAATLTLGKAFFLSSGSNASHAPQVMTGSTQALPQLFAGRHRAGRAGPAPGRGYLAAVVKHQHDGADQFERVGGGRDHGADLCGHAVVAADQIGRAHV